jgi:type IV fimbrial biogenesis protein FimT
MFRYKQFGFTLLELMICISLIAIISTISVPHIQTLLYNQRRAAALQRLKNAIYWARSSALYLQQPVVLCPSKNKTDCTNNWLEPLILFTDVKTKAKRDAGDKLLRIISSLHDGQLTFKAFPTARYLRFLPNGFTGQQAGSFYYCYRGAGWQLTINKGGRIYLAQSGAKACEKAV